MIDLESAIHANQSIVPQIYEAASDPPLWNKVVFSLAEFLDCEIGFIGISYLASGRGETLASVGLPDDMLELWQNEHAVNDWVDFLAKVKPGETVHANRDVPVEQIVESKLGKAMIQPLGVVDGVGTKLTDSPLFIGHISTYSTTGLLGQREVDRVDFLAPHLARSLALHQRFSILEGQSRSYEQAIDQLPVGVVVLHVSGDVMHANEAAHGIIGESDGVRLIDGRIVLDDREAQAALVAALSATKQPDPGSGPGALFSAQRPSGRRALHLVVSPPLERVPAAAEAGVVLWIVAPDEIRPPDPDRLATLLGLTPAEARAAAAIAAGRTVKEYAAQSGVSEGTARWTLKQVLNKTGMRSQADLVRLVVGSVPSPPF